MKHEIEIPDFPEGWEAVSFRVPEEGEYYLGSGGIKLAQTDFHYRWLIVRKKQPRRIVLEETGRYRGLHYSIDINDGNLILPPGREYKIVDDKNETRD